MGRCIKCFVFIFIILGASRIVGEADTIYFKNGARLDIEKAWEENGKVKCIMFGNEYEYQKDDIERIESNGTITPLNSETNPEAENSNTAPPAATTPRPDTEAQSVKYYGGDGWDIVSRQPRLSRRKRGNYRWYLHRTSSVNSVLIYQPESYC